MQSWLLPKTSHGLLVDLLFVETTSGGQGPGPLLWTHLSGRGCN